MVYAGPLHAAGSSAQQSVEARSAQLQHARSSVTSPHAQRGASSTKREDVLVEQSSAALRLAQRAPQHLLEHTVVACIAAPTEVMLVPATGHAVTTVYG